MEGDCAVVEEIAGSGRRSRCSFVSGVRPAAAGGSGAGAARFEEDCRSWPWNEDCDVRRRVPSPDRAARDGARRESTHHAPAHALGPGPRGAGRAGLLVLPRHRRQRLRCARPRRRPDVEPPPSRHHGCPRRRSPLYQEFHRLLALCTKARLGWPEEVVNKSATGASELVSGDAITKAIGYAIANPTNAGLVRRSDEWLGARRAQRVHHGERASSWETFGGRNPRFAAAGDAEAATRTVERNRKFESDYDSALAGWTSGDRKVAFPPGTWWMRVHHKGTRPSTALDHHKGPCAPETSLGRASVRPSFATGRWLARHHARRRLIAGSACLKWSSRPSCRRASSSDSVTCRASEPVPECQPGYDLFSAPPRVY